MQEPEQLFVPLSECLRTLEKGFCSKTRWLPKAESEGIFACDQSRQTGKLEDKALPILMGVCATRIPA